LLAIDTNVLVRAFVLDDPAQSKRAQKLFASQAVYVPVTVILELEWVLRSRYAYPPGAIADAMEHLVMLENTIVGEQTAVAAAATKLRQGWDFADALHHSLAEGCESFATFDAKLVRRAGRDVTIAPPVKLL